MRTTACVLSIILALPAVAQLQENVTVELIEVPVYVTGPHGEPIRGLSKDNFKLRVNGRSQAVEYFEAIDFARAAKSEQPASPQRAARERRLYLLLFDGSYTMPAKVVRAQKAAEYALERSNPDTDLFAVATYTLTKGIHFATPFVSDRIAIRRAIHTFTPGVDPLGLAMTSADRAKWIVPDYAFDAGLEGEMADTIRGGAVFQDLIADQYRHDVEDTLDELGDLAHRLSGLEGQKHVIYFSSGFPAGLIHGGDNPVPASVTSGGGLDAHAMATYNALRRAFASAGVSIDPVDIDGIRHQPGKIAAFNSDEGLQLLSDGTGGTYVHSRNDFGPAVDDMLHGQSNVYVLAFNRTGNRAGTIDVHVDGLPHGSRVAYRQGFGTGEPSKDVDPLQMADIVLHDIPQNAFTVKLDASPSALTMTVPREEIAASSSIDVLFYVFAADGTAVVGAERNIDASKNSAEEPLHLPAGRYVAKVIARVHGTASLGFARKEFTVE
jgi:VWFA-related protein